MENINITLISAMWLNKNNTSNVRKSYGGRIVENYELELILDGAGEIICNDISVDTIPNRLFIRTPGMVVNGITPYYSYYIIFSSNSHELENFNFPYYMDNMNYLIELFQTVYTENLNVSFLSQIKAHSALLELIYQLLNCISGNTADNMLKSIQYINMNYCKSIEVSTLAESSGYSLNHYITLFKQVKGVTPIKYINHLRITKACMLLSESDRTIEAIADDCGFESVSYFYRMFKKVKGITPSRFRKKLRGYYEI